MAASAAYAATPLLDLTALTATANTNRDGTTGVYTAIASGVASGKYIRRVTLCALGTTTAGVVRFFYSADSGTTKRLIKEVLVTAITPSATVEVFRTEVPEIAGLVLPGTTYQIYCNTHNAEAFATAVESGSF